MKEFLKYLGVVIILLGVAVLAIPYFTGSQSNTTLLVGMITITTGLIAQIVLNRVIE